MRFFGKIRGTNNDYYIAETNNAAAEDGDVEGNEPAGSGVNTNAYWVSH